MKKKQTTLLSYLMGLFVFVGVHVVVFAAFAALWILGMWLIVAIFSLFQ